MANTAAVVDEDGVTFVLADRNRRLAGVRLVQDLGLAELVFVRERTEWWLRLPRPPVDRMEYLFEVEDGNGHRHTIPDPTNPDRAPGAFGEKSVITFPGYAPPAWLGAPGVDGEYLPFEVEAPLLGAADTTVGGTVWQPTGLAGPAPLLVVHDGPEYAQLGDLVGYLAAGIASGELPPLRAALVGPGERNAWYSANPDYAETLVEALLPALPPSTVRVGVGVSLGALSMLHVHRTYPDVFDALLLQSGSFFAPDLDGQESEFSGWEPVTEFVATVHDAESDPHPVPVAMTCGIPEENLANNQRMAETLLRLGYPVQIATTRDAHNYTAWRDALHPHLTELVDTVAVAHAS
ncbi:MAG TPA: alpha/beta hydrolase-fold protein [Jatrophihabitantaceae bacterium]